MKHHDEGYALPFVLVVMVIICLVGISIMSSSLRNLQNQKASIKRMQDQYEVAGKIEKLMAEIKTNGCVSSSVIGNNDVTLLLGEDNKGFEYQTTVDKGIYKISTLIFDLEVKSNMTRIVCRVQVSGTITTNTDHSTYEISSIAKGAKIDPIYDFLSYEIINIAEEGSDESE